MKIVDVELREECTAYYSVTLEVPEDVTKEQITHFCEESFSRDIALFDEDDITHHEHEAFEVTVLNGKDAEEAQERRKNNEHSITLSCKFRRWIEEKAKLPPVMIPVELPKVQVDVDEATGYIGDGDNGVHYQVEEHGTFWYASALVECPNFVDDLFVDEGPFSNELQAIDHCQIEAGHWCSENNVEILDGTPGESPTPESVKLSKEILDLLDTKAGRALLATELVKSCCEKGELIPRVDMELNTFSKFQPTDVHRLMTTSDLIMFVVKSRESKDDGYLCFKEETS